MQQKGEELQAKQQAGMELTAGEVEEFNKLREGVESNKEARAFLEAQEADAPGADLPSILGSG